MIETKTKTCERCEIEFDIDEHYREAVIVQHPHPNDFVPPEGPKEYRYTLCGPCSIDFKDWLEPDDIEGIRERHATFTAPTEPIVDLDEE